MSADPERAWDDVRARRAVQADPRAQERLAQTRARQEALTKRLQAAQDEGQVDAQRAIEAQMAELARQQRVRDTRAEREARRTEAALRGAERAAQYPPNLPPPALTEGAPPVDLQIRQSNAPWMLSPLGLPSSGNLVAVDAASGPTKNNPLGGQPAPEAFEEALARSADARARRKRLEERWPPLERDTAAEEARRALGKALDLGVQAGLLGDWRALLLVASVGANADPIPSEYLTTLLYDLLAQAVRSRLLGPGRARTIARLIAGAADAPKDDTQPVPIPEAEGPLDPDALQALALRCVAVALKSREQIAGGPDLATLAWEAPGLIDRLQKLEALVYDALTVLPCHNHDLHLQSPQLCEGQALGQARMLVEGLGLDARRLPRDVHRDANGERAACCARDGRIGTWLVYGQYLNPDLKFGKRAEEGP